MNRIRQLVHVAWALLIAAVVSLQGAILVEPTTGTAVQTFSAQPAATEWSTLGVAGNAAAFTSASLLDADIIANVAAADVATVLGSSSTQPPSVSNVARRNTAAAGLYVQTRPNNAVNYILLMATLQNNTGGTVNFLNVSYDFNTAMGAGINIAEEIPGLRGFYSTTGDAGSWIPIVQFTTAAPGALSASLDVGNWASGSLLYILWADDEAASHNTGTDQEGTYTIDNFVAVPAAGRESSLTAFYGNANGWTAQFQDGTGALVIKASSITATLNGTAITPTFNKAGDAVTISHVTNPQLPSNTTNVLVLNYTDSATTPKAFTVTRNIIVAPYAVVPASVAVTGVDTASAGFKARMSHIAGPRTPGDVNSTFNAERQLLGMIIDPNTAAPYPNQALDAGTPDGLYAVTTVINWNETAPAAAGNFSATSVPAKDDELIPGIDLNLGTDDIVAEILTFLELKAGVVYRMGVNSDDGFKVTVGLNPRDALSLMLGNFNTGRGVADTTFDFTVEADGIYPFRLLWWEGTGGAAVEWFSVTPSGEKILINDRGTSGHIKAYSTGPTPPPFVKFVSPVAGDTNAPGNLVIEIKLEDAATAITASSVKLFVNNSDVTSAATITKAAGSTETSITYDPPGVLAPETRLDVRVEFTDNAGTPVTRTAAYFVKVKPLVVLPLDDTAMYRYNRTGDQGVAWREFAFDDSTWEGPGAPLIADESAAVEPVRTPISRFMDDGATHLSTVYFRGHFQFNGNPAAVNLLLRHVIDDAAIFYLNGVEIHRFGFATNAVVTYASYGAGHENVWEGPFAASRASLRNGDNVLAVEVHQSDGTSSDLVFGAELSVVNDPTAGPAKFVSVTPGSGSVNVATNAQINIVLEDGTTAVVPGSVKLTLNGGVANATVNKPAGGILTQVIYTPPAAGYTPETVINGKIEFTDSVGTVRSQEFSFTIQKTYEFIFTGDSAQMWRYLNTGEDAGTSWKLNNFDDSAWPEGQGMLAAETAATVIPINTPLVRLGPDGTTQIITDYFRTRFTLAGDPATTRLAIRYAVDDGALIYVNGQEVSRFYFTADESNITYTNVAGTNFTPTDHEGRDHWEAPVEIPAGVLRAGENVIAAEVHQNGPGSSDVVFALELMRITSGAVIPPDEKRFTSVAIQGDGSIRIVWTGGGVLQESMTLPATWADVVPASSPYTTPASGAARFFRIRP